MENMIKVPNVFEENDDLIIELADRIANFDEDVNVVTKDENGNVKVTKAMLEEDKLRRQVLIGIEKGKLLKQIKKLHFKAMFGQTSGYQSEKGIKKCIEMCKEEIEKLDREYKELSEAPTYSGLNYADLSEKEELCNMVRELTMKN